MPFTLAAAASDKEMGATTMMREVQCAVGRRFRFSTASERAVVEYEGRRITLPRRDLSIGQYYRSKDGALVIDGDFIAFVPRGDENWRDCRIAR